MKDLVEAFFLTNRFHFNQVWVQLSLKEQGHIYQKYNFWNVEAIRNQAKLTHLEFQKLWKFLRVNLLTFDLGREDVN